VRVAGPHRLSWRAIVAGLIAALGLGVPLAPARAAGSGSIARVAWQACGDGLDCGTVRVPRDYRRPRGSAFELALIRSPATDSQRRLGSLFLNPGGPGASGVALVRGLRQDGDLGEGPFAELNRRFDLVGFDPRGVGESRPSVQCLTDEEARAQFSLRLPTPDTLDASALLRWSRDWAQRCLSRNQGVLPYVSTGNVARDLDVMRTAVGDRRLTYLGFSYGTLLGATYASLFPRRTGALVLDGAVDADTWVHRPLEATREEAASFERALSRFFAWCAVRSRLCTFTDDDPEVAFDDLVGRLDRNPIPGGAGDPRPVYGGTVLEAAEVAMYRKSSWLALATFLA